jgi:putative peptidoglycan lipid II flippase
VAAASLALGIALALLLMGPLKHVGLALASSSASFVNFVWLMVLLKKRGVLGKMSFAKVFLPSAALALAMGAALWPLYRGEFFRGFGNAFLVLAGLVSGPVVYFSLAALFGSPNVKPLKDAVLRISNKFKRKKKT